MSNPFDRFPIRWQREQYARRHPWRVRLRRAAPWIVLAAVLAACWCAALCEGAP